MANRTSPLSTSPLRPPRAPFPPPLVLPMSLDTGTAVSPAMSGARCRPWVSWASYTHHQAWAWIRKLSEIPFWPSLRNTLSTSRTLLSYTQQHNVRHMTSIWTRTLSCSSAMSKSSSPEMDLASVSNTLEQHEWHDLGASPGTQNQQCCLACQSSPNLRTCKSKPPLESHPPKGVHRWCTASTSASHKQLYWT